MNRLRFGKLLSSDWRRRRSQRRSSIRWIYLSFERLRPDHMSAGWLFPIFVVVSFAAFVGILRVALHARRERPRGVTVLWVAALVVIGGMLFAKTGTSLGLPVAVYYGV